MSSVLSLGDSPNQVLTHAARAAASQPLCGRARRARRALVRATGREALVSSRAQPRGLGNGYHRDKYIHTYSRTNILIKRIKLVII